jgi:hypothetical protein
MEFSESNSCWQPVPRWASYLATFGLAWAAGRTNRRIGVISMPCESAGAGLVALGAVRYRLTLADASDPLSHFERLHRIAATQECSTLLRHRSRRGRWYLVRKDCSDSILAMKAQDQAADGLARSGPDLIAILEANAAEWIPEGEPPAETVRGAGLPHRRFYEELFEGVAPPLDINLARSDSAICLAGRVTGEPATRAAFSAIRFACGERVANLTDLLTVYSWSSGTVSRITFFNSRTRQLDRDTGFNRLVVADGDVAFLRALDAPEFEQSDVIGVINRAIERDRLESIGTKLADRAQWYVADTDALDRASTPPTGITISIMQRRQV